MLPSPAEDIVRRLAEGDDGALGELYQRFAGIVNSIACRILRNRAEAQDVVQLVFIQAWRQAERFDPARGSVLAWLCTLTRTRALDCLRRRLSRHEASMDPRAETVTIAGTEAIVAVRQALRTLPERQRRTLELTYYEGLTQVEIAERLGQPVGTVKTRARTALRRLRATLGPIGAFRWNADPTSPAS